jgi:hypothetical protein
MLLSVKDHFPYVVALTGQSSGRQPFVIAEKTVQRRPRQDRWGQKSPSFSRFFI